MTLEVWCAQTACPTSAGGTTDLVHGSITTTPVAALHMLTGSIVNGTPSNHGRIGFGMTDGVDDRYSSISLVNGTAESETYHNQGTTACVAVPNTGTNILDGALGHNSFIAGGQRVDDDNAFGNALLCSSMFFSCDSAKVLTATLSTSVDTAANVDPGFAWDALITIGVPRAGASSGVQSEIYFGFYDKTSQGCVAFNSNHAQLDGDPSLRISDSYVAYEMGLGTGSWDYSVEASVGAGTSCNLTTRNNGGDGDTVYCLFLGWSSSETVKVVSWDSPTVTGNNADTGAGIKPQALLNLFSFAAAYDSAEQGGDGGAFGVGMETANEQFCCSIADEQGSAAVDTQGATHNKSVFVEQDDGTAGYEAAFVSFDATGWTHNFSATEGAVNKFISLAFEETSAGGIQTQAMNHYRNHGKII